VKSEIHSGISRQLEALRNREVWLLNQVELIQNMKDEVLHVQQARLNKMLGVAQSGLADSLGSNL
jgi:nuclear receptor coactivator 4